MTPWTCTASACGSMPHVTASRPAHMAATHFLHDKGCNGMLRERHVSFLLSTTSHLHACEHSLAFVLSGGDLKLVSMAGYGVDAYLSIQHLEGDWQEQQVEAEAPEQVTAGEGAARAALPAPQLSHG